MSSPRQRSGKITVSEHSGYPVILIEGYFDDDLGLLVQQRVEELLHRGRITVLLDFSGCSAVNSLGVEKILNMVLMITEDFQGKLMLITLKPIMLQVFELAGIIPRADVASTIPGAISVLGPTGT
jgi:anti-anti-sigma regulatory factor